MIKDIELIENLLKIGTYNKMYRVNYNGLRLYVQEEPWAYFSGLTGALSAAEFKGNKDVKRLGSWRESMIDSFGKKNTEDYVDLTAEFGTLVHGSLLSIKEKGYVDWDVEFKRAENVFTEAFKKKNRLIDNETITKMAFDYQKHVSSLEQFVFDRVKEIYAIECIAKHDALRIATPIDMFCLCKLTEKGNYVNTTINIKTSSQISDHQYEQISMERIMWNDTYEQKAEATAILRTKDWNESKVPSYEFKYLNENDSLNLLSEEQTIDRLRLCLVNKKSTYYPLPYSKRFVGVTKIGEQPVITTTTIEEEWRANMELNNETLI
jgi:hypothetical protein